MHRNEVANKQTNVNMSNKNTDRGQAAAAATAGGAEATVAINCELIFIYRRIMTNPFENDDDDESNQITHCSIQPNSPRISSLM